VTNIHLPANEAGFEQLRAVARWTAGQGFAPGPTSSIVPASKPSPRSRASEPEGVRPKTPEDPLPRPAAQASSSGRGRSEEPARAPEKPKSEEVPELEPELDLADLFHGRHR
jgi:hypothetical protein